MIRKGPTPQGTALVTGASSGIGLQYARELAARGWPLLIVSNEERIADVARELAAATGTTVTPLCRDLSLPDAAQELVSYCDSQGIDVEILVNNAGIFFFNDLTEVAPEKIALMADLHMRTTTLLCHYFGRAMKERGHGYILNMASLSAWMPFPGISAYAASKSYLRQLSRALHDELHDHGIGVTAVCPGAVATDLYNLNERLQRLALRLGIMMTPRRLAEQGLRAMFRRKRCVVPGVINRLFLPLVCILPPAWIRKIKRKAKFYRYGK